MSKIKLNRQITNFKDKYLNSITITFAPPRVTPFHSFQNQSYISTVSSTKSNLLFISDEWIDF